MAAVKLALEATVITMLFIFILALLMNRIKQKPGKRFHIKNYCLTCCEPVPSDKEFCSDGCENDFYDESHLEREEDEALAEQRELEREERNMKAGIF